MYFDPDREGPTSWSPQRQSRTSACGYPMSRELISGVRVGDTTVGCSHLTDKAALLIMHPVSTGSYYTKLEGGRGFSLISKSRETLMCLFWHYPRAYNLLLAAYWASGNFNGLLSDGLANVPAVFESSLHSWKLPAHRSL